MALHILRDYAASAAGYYSPGGGLNYFFVPWVYNISIFLNKVLGYSVVGQTAWDINNTFVNTFTNAATVAIAAGSNGQSLPQSTIFGNTTTGFPNCGYIYVTTSTGTQIVKYNGITTGAFLNCTGGTGTMSSGIATTSTGTQALPLATINVTSTAGFPTSGTIFIVTSTGVQTVTYTGLNAGTQFTGCTGGTGTASAGSSVTSASSTAGSIACSPIRVTTASGTAPPTLTTNLPHGLTTGQFAVIANTTSQVPNGVWPVTVLSPTQFILQTVSMGAFVAGTTAQVYNPGMLIASGTVAGSTGATINQAGASSVYAVSIPPNVRVVQAGTAPSSGDVGRILVLKSSSYPTKNSGLFKISAINTGNSTTIAAGSNNAILPQASISVASTTGFPASGSIFVATTSGIQTVNYTGTSGGNTFTGCTGGTGTMSTGNVVNNFNGYNIDYRSTDTPPNDTMDWFLYEVETQTSVYINYMNNALTTGVGLLGTTNTIPIQVTTNISGRGDWQTGQKVTVSGVTGNTAANGTWTITVPNPNTTSGIFTLNGSVGNGTSASVGSVTRVGYTGGSNVSFNSKIILQSPHASGWQVRIAAEPYNVTGFPNTSVTIGYGGSALGDFPVGGTHTHMPQWVDALPTVNTTIANNLMGGSNTGVTASRTTIVGDDTGQCVFCYSRTQGATANGIMMFGIPDNEPSPPPININRMFAYGGVASGDFSGIQMRFGSSNNFGLTYRDVAPEVCAIAGWVNADGVSGASPAYATNGGDSPFTGTTEVLPWEIWGGIATDAALGLPFNATNGAPPYTINQRFMGTAPFLRQGRANFGAFTLSTDSVTAFTVSNASNTSPIQITTGATNALATGQTVVISGVNGNTAANGTFVITVIDNTHFTLNGTTGNGSYTSGGSGNGTPRWLHTQNGIYLQWNGAGGLTP